MKITEDEERAALVIFKISILHIAVNLRLLCRAKACAHIDAVCTQSKRRDQPAPIAKPATREHRNFHLIGGSGNEDEAGDVILARVPRAFKAID